jgi:hypothetical protein
MKLAAEALQSPTARGAARSSPNQLNVSFPPIADTSRLSDAPAARNEMGVGAVSISSEARDDIKAAQKVRPPRWALVLFGVLCLAAYWLFDHFGRFNMSLPVLDSIIPFGFVLYLKRKLYRKWWFWLTMALVALLHAFVIWSIPWTEGWKPAAVAGVILSVDTCLMLWLLAGVETLVGTRTADTSRS